MKHLLAMDPETGIILTNARNNDIVALVNGKAYNTIDYRPYDGTAGRQLRNDSQEAIKKMMPYAQETLARYEQKLTGAAPAPAPAPAPAIPAEISPLAKRIVTRLRAGLNVYLQGPAGCGKSFVAKQAAEILNVSYYESSAVIDIYTQLKGFVDANGVYQATAFYHAWKDGGVFLFDEIDASSPEALLDINNALASGGYTFPDAAGGYIERNPNCYIIAAANTAGNGGDGTYTARAALDKSSLDRYRSYIVVDYDREIELQLARGDTELVDFIHALRDTAKHCGFDALFTYRAISGIIAISEIDGREIAIQENIIRGMDKADIRIMSNNIGNYVDSSNTWAQVFIEMGRC